MSDKQETTADIIAEVRDKYTVHECNQCAWRKCCSEGFGSEKCGKFRESIFLKLGIEDGFFTQLLDRLEAAHRRERGDAAKLREALVQAELFVGNIVRHGHQTLVPGDKCTACDGAEELRDMICAALAAPPRNCDRPECATTKAAQDVWRKEDGGKTAYYEWLLATATEKKGGNDGN